MTRGGLVATVVAVVVLVAGLALKQDTGSSAASGPAVEAGKVNISDFKFLPPSVEVKAGSKLTFTNEDTAPHTATAKTGGAFDTGKLVKGQSKTVTLKKKGTFTYYCQFHAFMTAKVKVD